MTETSPRVRIAHVLLRLFRRGMTTPADAWQHLPTGIDVDKRRIADDLKLLASEGLIERRGDGRSTRYALPGDLLERHRGLLDHIALDIGREHTRFLAGTSLANPLDREDLDSPALRRLADRLDRRFAFLGEPERTYRDHEDTLDTIVDALVRSRRLTVRYGKDADRRVYPEAEPLTLVVYRRSVYLLIREPTLSEPRCLAVDRIADAALGDPFDYPEDWDPRAHFADVFGVVASGEATTVTMDFSPASAHLVAARVWHPSQRLTDLPDGGLRLRMRARGSELVRFALEWGRHCRVVGPPWLVDAVLTELDAARAAYE